MNLHLDRVESPIGSVLLVSDDEGRLLALDFAAHSARMRRLLRLRWGDDLSWRAARRGDLRARVRAYFAGELAALRRVRLRTGGTPFQRAVWEALREIPAGTTTTYGRIAARLGRPSASRAVGAANGANPVAIAVPCHRVIAADGALTGYAGGLERKRWLLAHEGVGRRARPREPARAGPHPRAAQTPGTPRARGGERGGSVR
jgi:methylated-DNA-[protein]-cysteine S-methyltransferase